MEVSELIIIAKCRTSFSTFVDTMLPQEYFTYLGEYIGVGKVQLKWVEAMEDGNRVLIEAFTGSGKTTIVEAYALWKLYFQKNYQVLIVSFNLTQSIKVLDEIKEMISKSKYLSEMMITTANDEKVRDTKTELNLADGRRIFCKPYGPGVKGVHVNLALCDEISEYKPIEIFFRNVATRVEAKDGKIICISTPVSETDLLHKLKDPERGYKIITVRIMEEIEDATDEKDIILWKQSKWLAAIPERFPKDKIIRILKDKGEYTFQREYMCNCTTSERGLFDPNDVAACMDISRGFNLSRDPDCIYYFGADFAISKTGDYSVFAVVEQKKRGSGGKVAIKYMQRVRGMDPEEQKERLRLLHKIFDFEWMVLDETNMGGQFVNALSADYAPVIGQNFEHKNRTALLFNIKKFIDSHNLIIPRKSGDDYMTESITDELYKELIGFGPRETETGTTTYLTQTSHDDCVMALGLALSKVQEDEYCGEDLIY
jgi:hypothetical protein